MDIVRFGLGVRALRRRRGWTQEELGSKARVSRSVVWRLERGQADRVAVQTLVRVAAVLGARIDVRLLWHGEGLDRLLDAGHASLLDRTLAILVSTDWEVATEVSFDVRGERGSIDILAFHAATGTLLVIEVKSVVPDMQAMLHALDRKTRLGPEIARARGWPVRVVARILVLPEERTARRRVVEHGATFRAALPDGNPTIRRWIRLPSGSLAGLLFLSDARQASARHRISRASGSVPRS